MAIGPIPGASVGGSSYTFVWHAERLQSRVDIAVGAAAERLAAEVQEWLRSNLHRYTGEMAENAYGRMDRTPTGFRITGGSDTDHTFYHEVRYHPQLRQCLDLFAPTMGARVREALSTL